MVKVLGAACRSQLLTYPELSPLPAGKNRKTAVFFWLVFGMAAPLGFEQRNTMEGLSAREVLED